MNEKINDRLDKLDKIIISLIRSNRYITIPELAKQSGKSQPTVYRHIEQLAKDGILAGVGSRKKGYWDIKD
ncbi:MAG: winged helix-turn-helix transcriptional regulator [Erysipelotrichaceae bacterium]|nr:winged helix-turn-helix transcriptional regulator [Erysipelotrichaceae bacterium]